MQARLLKARGGRQWQSRQIRRALKEPAEERRRFIRDADNLIRCLKIEFQIELGLGSTVVPVGKKSELAPAQAPLCERAAPDGDAHARRLLGDLAFFFDRAKARNAGRRSALTGFSRPRL